MTQLARQKSLIENLSSDQEKVPAYIVAGCIAGTFCLDHVFIFEFLFM